MARASDTVRVPWESRTLRVVLLSTVLLPLGVPLLSPVLPVIRDVFGLTDAQASLLVTAYFLPGIVLSPVIGMFADRVGGRRVLVPSLLAFGVSGGVVVTLSSFPAVLALRLVQGTAAAGVFITTVALLADTFDGLQRSAVIGVNVGVLFAGAAAYPLIGGVLAAGGWNRPFALYLVAIPIGLLAFRMLEEPTVGRGTPGLEYVRGAAAMLPARAALSLYGATFASETIGFGAIFTALPFLLTASYGLSPVAIGGVITISTATTGLVSAWNGHLVRRVTNGRLIALGFVLYGVSLVGMWFAPSALLIAVAAIVFGIGIGLTLPSIDAAITGIVPPEFRAGALSLRNSTTFLGRATGPVLFTGIAATTGYRPLLVAAGGIAFVIGVLGFAATWR